jgi:hypothetical protein
MSGATTVQAHGVNAWAWMAITALLGGVAAAAIVLAPWRLAFAVSARELYAELHEQALKGAANDDLFWLAGAGYGYQALRDRNAPNVRRMSRLSGVVAVLIVVQAIAWLCGLGLD